MGIWEWIDWNAEPLTAVIAFVATSAAIISYWLYHKESLQKNTMDLLSKFETDPVLHEVQKDLFQISTEYNRDYSKIEDKITIEKLKFLTVTMLNYFEDISYRYDKKIIDRKAVEKQLKEVMIEFVRVFLKGEKAGGRTPPPYVKDTEEKWGEAISENLQHLVKVYEQWEEKERKNLSS